MAAELNWMKDQLKLHELVEFWTQSTDKWFIPIQSLLEPRIHEACSHDVIMVRTAWLKHILSWPEKYNQAISPVATRIQEGLKLKF